MAEQSGVLGQNGLASAPPPMSTRQNFAPVEGAVRQDEETPVVLLPNQGQGTSSQQGQSTSANAHVQFRAPDNTPQMQPANVIAPAVVTPAIIPVAQVAQNPIAAPIQHAPGQNPIIQQQQLQPQQQMQAVYQPQQPNYTAGFAGQAPQWQGQNQQWQGQAQGQYYGPNNQNRKFQGPKKPFQPKQAPPPAIENRGIRSLQRADESDVTKMIFKWDTTLRASFPLFTILGRIATGDIEIMRAYQTSFGPVEGQKLQLIDFAKKQLLSFSARLDANFRWVEITSASPDAFNLLYTASSTLITQILADPTNANTYSAIVASMGDVGPIFQDHPQFAGLPFSPANFVRNYPPGKYVFTLGTDGYVCNHAQ